MAAPQLAKPSISSNWLAYIGGKYYDYPNGKASFHIKLNVHHGDTDDMLKKAIIDASNDDIIMPPDGWAKKPGGVYDKH